MTADAHNRGDHGFWVGLLAGTFVGAGLAIWLAPRVASELRERVAKSAKDLGSLASERYRQVSARVTETVEDLSQKGEHVRNEVADAVVRGAHEVERIATAAKTDRVNDARKHPTA